IRGGWLCGIPKQRLSGTSGPRRGAGHADAQTRTNDPHADPALCRSRPARTALHAALRLFYPRQAAVGGRRL
ncbi:hypothetical protein LTR94_033354, partial [Friedmanniomyces endolithicus]